MSQFSDVRDPTIQGQAESKLRTLLRKNVFVRHSYKDIYFQTKNYTLLCMERHVSKKLFKNYKERKLTLCQTISCSL